MLSSFTLCHSKPFKQKQLHNNLKKCFFRDFFQHTLMTVRNYFMFWCLICNIKSVHTIFIGEDLHAYFLLKITFPYESLRRKSYKITNS